MSEPFVTAAKDGKLRAGAVLIFQQLPNGQQIPDEVRATESCSTSASEREQRKAMDEA
jgi:hypothetical protein